MSGIQMFIVVQLKKCITWQTSDDFICKLLIVNVVLHEDGFGSSINVSVKTKVVDQLSWKTNIFSNISFYMNDSALSILNSKNPKRWEIE